MSASSIVSIVPTGIRLYSASGPAARNKGMKRKRGCAAPGIPKRCVPIPAFPRFSPIVASPRLLLTNEWWSGTFSCHARRRSNHGGPRLATSCWMRSGCEPLMRACYAMWPWTPLRSARNIWVSIISRQHGSQQGWIRYARNWIFRGSGLILLFLCPRIGVMSAIESAFATAVIEQEYHDLPDWASSSGDTNGNSSTTPLQQCAQHGTTELRMFASRMWSRRSVGQAKSEYALVLCLQKQKIVTSHLGCPRLRRHLRFRSP